MMKTGRNKAAPTTSTSRGRRVGGGGAGGLRPVSIDRQVGDDEGADDLGDERALLASKGRVDVGGGALARLGDGIGGQRLVVDGGEGAPRLRLDGVELARR